MNTFDSITLQFDSSCIVATPNTTINPNVNSYMQVDKYGCTSNHVQEYGLAEHGVSYIKQTNDNIQIAFSAKTLLDDYAQGLHINNIEQAIENINKIASFQFDKNKLIDSAYVRKVDSTQMIYPNYDLGLCCDSMMSMRTNSKCKVSKYNSKHNRGIVFDSSIKKEKRRLIMYDKLALLLYGNKSAKAFLSHCKNSNKVLNDCKGSLRVEQAHTSFKSMRNRFKVIGNRLISIFNSVENVNHNYLLDLKSNSQQLDIFLDSYEHMRLMDIEKLEGRKNICLHFNLDMELIKTFLQSKLSRTVAYKYIKDYEQVVAFIKQAQNPQLAQSEQINNHILQLIKECA